MMAEFFVAPEVNKCITRCAFEIIVVIDLTLSLQPQNKRSLLDFLMFLLLLAKASLLPRGTCGCWQQNDAV